MFSVTVDKVLRQIKSLTSSDKLVLYTKMLELVEEIKDEEFVNEFNDLCQAYNSLTEYVDVPLNMSAEFVVRIFRSGEYEVTEYSLDDEKVWKRKAVKDAMKELKQEEESFYAECIIPFAEKHELDSDDTLNHLVVATTESE